MGNYCPRQSIAPPLPDDTLIISGEYDNPFIAGVSHNGVYRSKQRDRIAQVNIIGNILKQSPRREQTLAQMESLFEQILNSFRFLELNKKS